MAETWAIKARVQSNQLCAIPPWYWLCQACVPLYKQAARPRPDPQSGELWPHMNQDMKADWGLSYTNIFRDRDAMQAEIISLVSSNLSGEFFSGQAAVGS